MLLKFAITILLTPVLNSQINNYAKKLLCMFVGHSIKVYGKEFCIYNVHALIHLADDAQRYGSLNSISCFPFEN